LPEENSNNAVMAKLCLKLLKAALEAAGEGLA
jgi:hypothetical protein